MIFEDDTISYSRIFIAVGIVAFLSVLIYFLVLTSRYVAKNKETYTNMAQERINSDSNDYGLGNSGVLNGKSYILVPEPKDIHIQKGFTVEMWFKPEKAINNNSTLIEQSDGKAKNFSLSINSYLQDDGNYQYNYQFLVKEGANCNDVWALFQKILSPSEAVSWQHIAGVIQPGGKLDMYINGKRSIGQFVSVNTLCSANVPLYVGVDGSKTSYFIGKIDEVRISDTARYEIDFVPTLGSFPIDLNTQLLYHFNSKKDMGKDSIITDDSGSGNDGTIIGSLFLSDSFNP